MSDFPTPETYRSGSSLKHLCALEKQGLSASLPIVVSREKGQYVTDIDGNKYCDFSLHDGAVIYGHAPGVLTRLIKNGLSCQLSPGRAGKALYRLVRLLNSVSRMPCAQFYSCETGAWLALFNKVNPARTGVSSVHLLEKLRGIFPRKDISVFQSGKDYDLGVFEPLDFDGGLKPFDAGMAGMAVRVSYEGRTAFRVRYGFLSGPESADYIVAGACAAAGMDTGVVLSKGRLPWAPVPAYQALAVLESLKFYKRKVDYSRFGADGSHPLAASACGCTAAICGSIVKLKAKPDPIKALENGLIIEGDIVYLCSLHTDRDLFRLKRFLDAVK